MEVWIMIIAMFALMYFLMIRPENKRKKEWAVVALFPDATRNELQQKCGCSGGQLRAVCLQLHLLAGDDVPYGMAAFTPGGCAGVRRGSAHDDCKK